MTFQRKLLFGFSLMVLPALLVGAEAIRSNLLERRALERLGQSMARTRTYAELETAMFDQGEIIWRGLSGLDPSARREFALTGDVAAAAQVIVADPADASPLPAKRRLKDLVAFSVSEDYFALRAALRPG